MRIYDAEINAYAREHKCSYQEAWRALVNESSDAFVGKQPAVTKFSMKESVKILNMAEEGTVANISVNKVWACPKYTVVLNESGRAITLDETELIKKG